MKKLISLFLAVLMMIGCCSIAFAEDAAATGRKGDQTLKFNENGKFKIMQINDTQDTDKMNKRTEEFIRKAVAQEKPDLVVIPGDVCNDIFIGANEKRVKQSLRNLASLLNELKVPFAYTPGNHDHDKDDMVSTLEQMQVFNEFEYNVWDETKTNDPGTYNIPIMSSDGSRMALNVYMIDSQNKSGLANGYTGPNPESVEWYKAKSDELRAANGGKVVPSLVFQHVPVWEIYQCLTKTDVKHANDAIFSLNDYQWYVENEKYMFTDETRMKKNDNYVGEAPCSEIENAAGNEYEAWLEKGDVIGAFFAHDHVNHFVMKTDDGILLGYNGGTGFAAYGRADKRSIRIYEVDENDVENYTIDSVYYSDITGKHFGYYVSDFMSTAIFGDILRFLARLVFITPWKGSR